MYPKEGNIIMNRENLIDNNGQKIYIKDVARLNDLNYQTLWNKYKETGDIDKAVAISKEIHKGPRKYIDFLGEKMTINQIAKVYGLDEYFLKDVYKLTANIDEAVSFCVENVKKNGWVQKLEQQVKVQKNTVSIDKYKHLAKNSFPETSLKSNNHTFLNNCVDSIKLTENKIFIEEMNQSMQQILTPHEMEILRLRFGLEDGCYRNLTETGHILGVTKERIRQIENRALTKFRESKNVERFANYDYEM